MKAVRWGCFPMAALLILSLVTFCHLGAGCNLLARDEVASPENKWVAVSDLSYCPSPIVTIIPASVEIISNLNPRHRAEMLAVDTSGYKDERPRVVWTASNVLQVTVPSRSYLSVIRRSYQGIWIDLRFDPDRATRDAWLEKYGMQPDPLEK